MLRKTITNRSTTDPLHGRVNSNVMRWLMEWVSVKSELPKVNMAISDFKPCLVVNCENVQWAMFNGKTKRFQDAKYYDIHNQVTYWMPLPPAPHFNLIKVN